MTLIWPATYYAQICGPELPNKGDKMPYIISFSVTHNMSSADQVFQYTTTVTIWFMVFSNRNAGSVLSAPLTSNHLMPGHQKSGKPILHHSNHSYIGNIKPVCPVNSLYSTHEVWASETSQSKQTQNSVLQYIFPNVIAKSTKVKCLASNKWCIKVIGVKTLPIPWIKKE